MEAGGLAPSSEVGGKRVGQVDLSVRAPAPPRAAGAVRRAWRNVGRGHECAGSPQQRRVTASRQRLVAQGGSSEENDRGAEGQPWSAWPRRSEGRNRRAGVGWFRLDPAWSAG